MGDSATNSQILLYLPVYPLKDRNIYNSLYLNNILNFFGAIPRFGMMDKS